MCEVEISAPGPVILTTILHVFPTSFRKLSGFYLYMAASFHMLPILLLDAV
jgi:hypothetical protein